MTVKFKFGKTVYSVTENGRVTNSAGKELRPHADRRIKGEPAQLRLALVDGTKTYKVRLHRIMGICFLNATNNDVIGYRDGDVNNNTRTNLYIVKQRKNATDASNFVIPINSAPESTFKRARGYQQNKKTSVPAPRTVADNGLYVKVSNGYGTFPVLEMDFYNYSYFKKHGFQIVA